MDIELRQLRILHTVAQAGSINRAAEELGMSQSALSRALQRVERTVGMQLLNRQPTGITLTTAGSIVLGHAETVLPALRRMFTDVRSCTAPANGRSPARIGAAPSPTLTSFVRCVEDLGIAPLSLLVDDSGQRLVQLLAQNEIDVAMFRHFPELDPEPPENVRHEVIATQSPYVCLPDDHPLAGRPAVHLPDLDADHFVVSYPECQPLTGHFQTACTLAGARPRISYANSATAAIALGEALGAVTLTYWPRITEPRRVHVALHGTPLGAVMLLAWTQDGPLGDISDQFIGSVQAMHTAFACLDRA
ncbi:LysR family transcriptional regulator [Actinomadura darangshiensis]|uniref:LysR family transcriptional regulator n=1 Tax=Actinomadura darangshiensis TaxID=705336 RepID=A0A4R5BHY4_9ACTN|nr:LysR family transcriptional regulator [Actinomadura darangshiensis]TDD83322.1 LysR family transcriptional regulator [Actinomadura darangshiensis]